MIPPDVEKGPTVLFYTHLYAAPPASTSAVKATRARKTFAISLSPFTVISTVIRYQTAGKPLRLGKCRSFYYKVNVKFPLVPFC
jgi:hypothetical protein